ncbi:MAG: putative bifunctional diguanylate cyclase/phosphodiesterase [Motilibacteraceae bacterium]
MKAQPTDVDRRVVVRPLGTVLASGGVALAAQGALADLSRSPLREAAFVAAAASLLLGGLALLLRGADRLTIRGLEAVMTAATVVVGLLAVLAGPSAGGRVLAVLVWWVPGSFGFLPRRRAAGQVLLAVVVAAVAVVANGLGAGRSAVVLATVASTLVAVSWLVARITDYARARTRQQLLLAEFGRRALAETDERAVLEDAVRTARRLVGGDEAFLALLDAAGATTRIVAVDPPGRLEPGTEVPLTPGLPSTALLTSSAPLVVTDRASDPRFPAPVPVATSMTSLVGVAVPGPNGPYGTLRVHSDRRRRYSRDDGAALEGLANLVANAVERARTQSSTAYAALHDALTGLPNRVMARQALLQALSSGPPALVAVLLVDLDDFKDLNDGFGHAAGDEALVALAPRLRASVREGDLVARLGGDEFLVVAGSVPDQESALALADRVAGAWALPVRVGEREHWLTGSVGLATVPRPAPGVAPLDLEALAERLLSDADAAMYRSKARARGAVTAYDEEMRAQSLRRIAFETDLRHAAERGELSLAYQPLVHLRTGEVQGVEALLRWTHPALGPVGPDEFVPVAERTGLIAELGRWALEEAARTVAGWQAEGLGGPRPLGVSVNLSPVQLGHPDLPGVVAEVLRCSGLAAGTLSLEVTEGVLLEDLEQAAEVLEALGAAGAKIVLDDFGTGYSSLAYLHRLPLDAVKLDRGFAVRLTTDTAAQAVVRAVVGLGRELGIAVVAEGVEEPEQQASVEALGVRLAQGYLLARPMPAPAAREWLAARPAAEPVA